MNLLEKARSIKSKGIWGFFLIFTLVGILVTIPMTIVCAFQIGGTDWENDELNNSKSVWVVFCIILLGPLSAWIFANKAIRILSSTSK